jgi:hypothetical protein
MQGNLEDPQVSLRLERQSQINAPLSKRVKGHGIGDRVKSRFLEDAHCARHVEGGSDDKPVLRRFRMDDRGGEAGVSSVLRDLSSIVTRSGAIPICHMSFWACSASVELPPINELVPLV